MTMPKTIQLQRTGLTPIDIEPVWVDDKVILFDGYVNGEWIGSKSLLKYWKQVIKPTIEVKETERTYPKLVFIILTQEILPRVKKNKLHLSDFPTAFCSVLCDLEFRKIIDRKKHRKFLDDHCEWVKAGRPRDLKEDEDFLRYIEKEYGIKHR